MALNTLAALRSNSQIRSAIFARHTTCFSKSWKRIGGFIPRLVVRDFRNVSSVLPSNIGMIMIFRRQSFRSEAERMATMKTAYFQDAYLSNVHSEYADWLT